MLVSFASRLIVFNRFSIPRYVRCRDSQAVSYLRTLSASQEASGTPWLHAFFAVSFWLTSSSLSTSVSLCLVQTNPRNDFCRLFCKFDLPGPLVLALIHFLDLNTGDTKDYAVRCASILLCLSHGDVAVKTCLVRLEAFNRMLVLVCLSPWLLLWVLILLASVFQNWFLALAPLLSTSPSSLSKFSNVFHLIRTLLIKSIRLLFNKLFLSFRRHSMYRVISTLCLANIWIMVILTLFCLGVGIAKSVSSDSVLSLSNPSEPAGGCRLVWSNSSFAFFVSWRHSATIRLPFGHIISFWHETVCCWFPTSFLLVFFDLFLFFVFCFFHFLVFAALDSSWRSMRVCYFSSS